MARVALLIGTGQYEKGFKPLPAAPRDVDEIATVLRDPERGGFDHVDTLIDQPSTTIAETIETWFRARQKDDLALLYISGHGVKDAQSELYFAACNTRKKEEELVRSTAVAASVVRDRIRESKAKRQVIILDCCFSGAFGNLLSKDDDTINLETLLGAEGRVVLTSSNSIQYSFEQKGEDLSIYTRYLVEGIKTAAADKDGDGKISVQELHDYAKRKVQAESPDMTPTIIVLKDEGYQIWIAKAPQGDPKVTYRKEVEAIVQEDGGKIDEILSRRLLDERQKNLGLSPLTAQTIEKRVLAPIRQRQAKVTHYKENLTNVLQRRPHLGEQDYKRLEQIQRASGLRDEDVKAIHDELLPQAPILEPPQPITKTSNTVAGVPVPQLEVILKSEKGLNYTQLEWLLREEDWKLADEETYRLMICAVGKAKGNRFSSKELLNFPSADLKTIDRLWVIYSRGTFGFSVQKRISKSMWNEDFLDRFGWRQNGLYRDYDSIFEECYRYFYLDNGFDRRMEGRLPVAVVLQSVYSSDYIGWARTILILIILLVWLLFSLLCSYQVAKFLPFRNAGLLVLAGSVLLIFFVVLLLFLLFFTVLLFNFVTDKMREERTWPNIIIRIWLNNLINRSRFNFSLLQSLLSHQDL